MPEIRSPAAGPGGIFPVWFGSLGFHRKTSRWSCDGSSSQRPCPPLGWNKGGSSKLYFIVEFLILNIWPNDLSLGGGWWLFNTTAFFLCTSLYEDGKSNIVRLWYLKTCLSIPVGIIRKCLFFPQVCPWKPQDMDWKKGAELLILLYS